MTRQLVETWAQRWLTDAGVWKPGRSHAQNMQACVEARSRWGRLGAEPGKQWARDLVERYKAGECLHPTQIRLAHEALGIKPEPVLRKPARPVPRPDARERQAGDVTMEF